jgi:hypothetical protein
LADTLDILLDKGLVIDASIRVSIIGIEILSIEARIVIASVDTYIRFLEAMQRLDAAQRATPGTVAQAVTSHSSALTYGIAGPLGAPPPTAVGPGSSESSTVFGSTHSAAEQPKP